MSYIVGALPVLVAFSYSTPHTWHKPNPMVAAQTAGDVIIFPLFHLSAASSSESSRWALASSATGRTTGTWVLISKYSLHANWRGHLPCHMCTKHVQVVAPPSRGMRTKQFEIHHALKVCTLTFSVPSFSALIPSASRQQGQQQQQQQQQQQGHNSWIMFRNEILWLRNPFIVWCRDTFSKSLSCGQLLQWSCFLMLSKVLASMALLFPTARDHDRDYNWLSIWTVSGPWRPERGRSGCPPKPSPSCTVKVMKAW